MMRNQRRLMTLQWAMLWTELSLGGLDVLRQGMGMEMPIESGWLRLGAALAGILALDACRRRTGRSQPKD